MIENVISRRYARALAQAAVEANEVERASEEMNRLADILDPEAGDISVPELLDFLSSPTVLLEHKVKLTDVICEKLQIGQLVSDFLNVLIRRGRVPLAGRIAREYVRIASEIEKISTAMVYTAKELGEPEEERLREALEEMSGERIRLQVRRNKKLIAGVRVKIGDMLYDGSLLGRMERLASRLGTK